MWSWFGYRKFDVSARNVGWVLVIQQTGNDITITRRDRFDLASVGNANRLEEEQLQAW